MMTPSENTKKVIGAVHYMWRHYPEAVGDKSPILATMPLKNPG